MKKKIESHFEGKYEEFYGKHLEKVHKAGQDEFKALCPFHEDTNPSFSFNKNTGQYYCHGCGAKGDIFNFYAEYNGLNIKRDFQKVVKGIANDFGIPLVYKKPEIVKTYDYTDPGGKLLFQVCRMEPKSFRQRKPDDKGGWIWKITGVKRVLYRLPEIITATEVLIVEGEQDADNLSDLGFTATTCPMGAGKWKTEYSSFLKGKDVVLIPDNDNEGREHMTQVAQGLQGKVKGLKWLDLPELKDKGDVSDFIKASKDKDQAAEKLAVMIEGASPYKPEKERQTSYTAKELMSTEFPEPRWAVPEIIPEGCNILAGKPKMGKSMMCLNLAIAVTTGGKAFGEIDVEKGSVLYLALEDTGRRLKVRLTEMLQGSAAPDNLYIELACPKIENGKLPELDKKMEEIKDLRLVVIDTLQIIRPAHTGKYKTPYAIDSEDIRVIKDLADKHGIAIIIVHHLRKTESEDIMDDISGTFGLTGAADGVLAIKRITGRADAELNIVGRDIEAEKYALKFHPDILSWELLGKAEEVKSTAIKQSIYNLIRDAHEPITVKEIMQTTGIKRATLYYNLGKLEKEGSIENVPNTDLYQIKPVKPVQYQSNF
ncbi:DNA primase [subsurface metagenome]